MHALLMGISMAAVLVPTLQLPTERPPRWSSHVVTVWVDPRAAPPGAEPLVTQALATWTRAAGGRLVLQQTREPNSALVRIRFAPADGVYGETSPQIDRATGTIGSADVLISGHIAGDALYQRIVIYLTALHELGHALGLPHTAAFDDIMYSFRRADDGERYFSAYRRRLRTSDDIGMERATGLSPADVAALRALYDR